MDSRGKVVAIPLQIVRFRHAFHSDRVASRMTSAASLSQSGPRCAKSVRIRGIILGLPKCKRSVSPMVSG